jgi:hypothetical protein
MIHGIANEELKYVESQQPSELTVEITVNPSK